MPEKSISYQGYLLHKTSGDSKMVTKMAPDAISNDESTPMEEVRVIDKQSFEYVIRSGIAGGIAGSAAKTLIAPLDRVKILFQTSNPDFLKYRGKFFGLFRASKQIWLNDGIYGLFQGHSVTLMRIFPYAAIKFVAYEQIRAVLIPDDLYETAIRRIMAGSFSGLLSVFFTYPLDLVRVRMAFETKSLRQKHNFGSTNRRGMLHMTIRNIFNETPPMIVNDSTWLAQVRNRLPPRVASISNFYRGFAPTILGMIPYAGVAFYTHDLIHDMFRSKYLSKYAVSNSVAIQNVVKSNGTTTSRDSRPPLRVYAQLCAGGIAGMCSQTAAYPFEVIRRRMQVGGTVNQGRFLSFTDTGKLIIKESGVRGLFVGLSIGYLKVIPMAACSFFVYERCKLLIGI
ncbi:uncharacterized protein PRCAT00003230001 [Priceomyces carsonii]|uniref:uncharacterized protein n=1 Tax=Priceomyces carsonii TaxID=28549 RepID=UPI002ED8A724|nr:unnamed protein product [Priceomyces carsonii]